MSSRKSTRSFLLKEILENERLMKMSKGHPFMARSYQERIDELKDELAKLPDEDAPEPRVVLSFYGKPVWGSMGIDSTFAANVLSPFQKMVMQEYAHRSHGSNARRGQVKDSDESRMMLVGLPRGSFGLELAKLDSDNYLDDAQLGETLGYLVELVKSAAENDDSFADRMEGTDSRVLRSLEDFLKIISTSQAGLKITSGDATYDLSVELAKEAYERVSGTGSSTSEVKIKGVLRGVLLDSWRFEFTDETGRRISGFLAEDIPAEEAKLLFQQHFDKECTATFDKTVIRYRNGRERTSFTLKGIVQGK